MNAETEDEEGEIYTPAADAAALSRQDLMPRVTFTLRGRYVYSAVADWDGERETERRIWREGGTSFVPFEWPAHVHENRRRVTAIFLALDGLSALEHDVTMAVLKAGEVGAAAYLGLSPSVVANAVKKSLLKLEGKRTVTQQMKHRRMAALTFLEPARA
jgi:Mg-chelatase subunit ChlI